MKRDLLVDICKFYAVPNFEQAQSN